MRLTNLPAPLGEVVEILAIGGVDSLDPVALAARYRDTKVPLTQAELNAFNDHFPDLVAAQAVRWGVGELG